MGLREPSLEGKGKWQTLRGPVPVAQGDGRGRKEAPLGGATATGTGVMDPGLLGGEPAAQRPTDKTGRHVGG